MYSKTIGNMLLVIALVFFFTSSCSNPIEVISGELEGQVILVNDSEFNQEYITDFSGISVALYKTLSLDSIIVDLNKTYPNLGVKISQETEFDHRLDEPFAVKKTTQDGRFEFKNIPVGRYNFIALKEGWGSRECFDINISAGHNSIEGISSDGIVLYKEMSISGVVDYEITMLPYHHYVIEDETYLAEGARLNVNSFSTIRINPGGSLNLIGAELTANSTEGLFKIISNHLYFRTGGVVGVEKYDGVKIYEGTLVTGGVVQNAVIRDGVYSLYNQVPDVKFMNMRVMGEVSGLYLYGKQPEATCEVSNIVLSGTGLPEQSSLVLHNLSNVTVDNCIVFDNSIGVSVREVGYAEIRNSYLSNDDIDIRLYNGSEAVVTNCSFKGNTGVENSRGSKVSCFFNDFRTSIGIDNIFVGGTTGFPYTAYITANNNNFYCTQFSVRTRARFYSKDIIYFDVTNNYWGTESEQDIRRKIWDRGNEDMAGSQYDQLMAVFKYVPFRITPINNTGIVKD